MSGLWVLSSAPCAYAQGACTLEERVGELESRIESLGGVLTGEAGPEGESGETGPAGEQGPAGEDSADEALEEYGKRLPDLAAVTQGLQGDLASALTSLGALENKVAGLKQKLSNLNRNPYLIEGLTSKLGGAGNPVLSWPEGETEVNYATSSTNFVRCSDPVAFPFSPCVYTAVFTPGYIPPARCSTDSSGVLACNGDVTTVEFVKATLPETPVEVPVVTFQINGTLPKNMTPDLSAYFQNIGLDPVIVSGVCLSVSTPNGYDVAGAWAQEPALRLAQSVRQDASAIEAKLAEYEADPPGVAPDDTAGLEEAKAAYALAIEGIRALAAGTEQEAARYIYAASTAKQDRFGAWRYLYSMEQAKQFIAGIRGNTAGWSDAKLASFNTTKARISDYVMGRRIEIGNKARAINSEWERAAEGDALTMVSLFKSPDYPDVIQFAIDEVNQEAHAALPPDVAAMMAGAAVTTLPVAGVMAAGLIGSAIGSSSVAGASLFAGLSSLGATAIGTAGSVAAVAFPVAVVAGAVIVAVVAGKQAWETKENKDRYKTYMGQDFYAAPDIAAMSDAEIQAAFVDWQLSYLPKNGMDLGCL